VSGWRDGSGNPPSIPDENCSSYNRSNLTVEDMDLGRAQRAILRHDHPLAGLCHPGPLREALANIY
jgi:hypothetical protein